MHVFIKYAILGMGLLFNPLSQFFVKHFDLMLSWDVKELKDFTNIDLHFSIYLFLNDRFLNF